MQSKNIGVSGLKIHWMRSRHGGLHWCRTYIAIMGDFNNPIEVLSKSSPFDPSIVENFVEGKGHSKEEALSEMEKQLKDLTNSIWQF